MERGPRKVQIPIAASDVSGRKRWPTSVVKRLQRRAGAIYSGHGRGAMSRYLDSGFHGYPGQFRANSTNIRMPTPSAASVKLYRSL